MFRFCYKDIDFTHKVNDEVIQNDVYGKHLHSFNEIVFFVSGSARYWVESESKALEKHDVILIPSGKYHFVERDNAVDYDRFVLKFHDSAIPEYLVGKIKEKGVFFTNSLSYKETFDNISYYNEMYDNDEEKYIMFKAELSMFLIKLLNDNRELKIDSNESIRKIVDYIDSNLDKPLSLEHLSNAFSFSKSYISIGFKEYMKMPVMKYVRYKKILAAYELIKRGEKKSYVAKRFGFTNYSTFYRSYLKVIGNPNEKE